MLNLHKTKQEVKTLETDQFEQSLQNIIATLVMNGTTNSR